MCYRDQELERHGRIINPRQSQRLKMLTRDLVVYGAVLRGQFDRDLIDRERETFAARCGR